jgi:Putative Actinobacterial Holin-X, holin superfamily III
VDEVPQPEREPSFSELTTELIEQAARLAGERMAAPIRAAGRVAARTLAVGALGAGAFVVGMVFLGLAVGYVLRMAPEESRWWICLVVAAAFIVLGAGVTAIAARRGGRGKPTDERREPGP